MNLTRSSSTPAGRKHVIFLLFSGLRPPAFAVCAWPPGGPRSSSPEAHSPRIAANMPHAIHGSARERCLAHSPSGPCGGRISGERVGLSAQTPKHSQVGGRKSGLSQNGCGSHCPTSVLTAKSVLGPPSRNFPNWGSPELRITATSSHGRTSKPTRELPIQWASG